MITHVTSSSPMITHVTHEIYTHTHTKLITEFIYLHGTFCCDADMLDVGTETVNHNYYFKVQEGIAPL
jgi:hypothetical protein